MSVCVALDITPGLLIRSGVGRYSRELRSALEETDGTRVLPLAATAAPSEPGLRRLIQAGVREALYYPALLSWRARRWEAELIHCPAPAPIWSAALPVAVTVHDLLPLTHPHLLPRLSVAHARAALPFVRRAARILTNSEYTRHEVIERLRVPSERVVAAPFGVNERFRPSPADRDWLQIRFGIAGRFLLSVGTLEPRKNLAGLLRAFTHLQQEIEDCDLLLVGAHGWQTEELRPLLEGAKRVKVAGFVSDDELVKLYSSCACFAYPSLAEGFGFPPLEAMACGAPVVASNRPAMPEVLGDAALFCDPADPSAIAAAIATVMRDERLAGQLRIRGIQRSELFRWSRCAEMTAQIYRDMVQDVSS